jgi:hypothetical protein
MAFVLEEACASLELLAICCKSSSLFRIRFLVELNSQLKMTTDLKNWQHEWKSRPSGTSYIKKKVNEKKINLRTLPFPRIETAVK